MDLTKKAIFISGCDSGFGYSLALHCANNLGLLVIAGCYVPGGDESGWKSLESSTKGNLKLVHLDVTKSRSIEEAVKATKAFLHSQEARLWCVVNNAAVLVFGQAEWQPMDMIRHQFEVNTFGAFALAKAFLPMLRESEGRIINMISYCTDCPMPTLTVYTASKAALKSLSIGLREELITIGAKVDVILFNPGDHPFETPLCSGQGANYEVMEKEVEHISDSRLFKDHFLRCREKFAGLFPKPELKPLDNVGLYHSFEAMISSRHPDFEYVNSDLITQGFFGLIKKLPTHWADKMRISMMKLPK
ncbi:hypothetical protein TCAL_09392 [Tigriopus californicus]|uniref:Uncharacterized protein n=2 Tax=Tigriopus californicus TaxID=6832 RepID=A0A553NSY6_TIGCA|nr:hypothetical protein TCAL_09392 [Tigriopus californicus]|eukprot:TCALIF_09392-PA protein Name:"Similar to Bdh1 D-beta-hydroxybutyrate dehydrogenase, mitochondrial (Mus musculus)" AED:0.05 eAED:0.05 QI:0/-1/0/1/-1/1/1/0/303